MDDDRPCYEMVCIIPPETILYTLYIGDFMLETERDVIIESSYIYIQDHWKNGN